MKPKLVLLAGLCVLLINVLQAQPSRNKYSFSVSSGYAFEEKKPVVYFNLNYHPIKDFFVGLKAGCYAYDESVDEVVTRLVADMFSSLQPGTYIFFPHFKKQTSTYITALNSGYRVNDKFTVNFSLGVKYYRDFFYEADFVKFTKSYQGQVPPNVTITPDSYVYMEKKKDILKGYISAGLDYKIKSYSFGIFADNIFSAGINIGKEF